MIKEINFKYDISPNEMNSAMKFFDRKTKFNGRMAFTSVLGIVAALYTYDWIVRQENQSFSIFIIGICLGFIAVMWVNAANRRKSLTKAMELGANNFAVTVNETEIITTSIENEQYIVEDNTAEDGNVSHETFGQALENITTKSNETAHDDYEHNFTYLKYNDNRIVIYKLDNMFVVFISKEWFYVFPFRCIEKEKIKVMEEIFAQKLGERFVR